VADLVEYVFLNGQKREYVEEKLYKKVRAVEKVISGP
jgi:hypothetical protein